MYPLEGENKSATQALNQEAEVQDFQKLSMIEGFAFLFAVAFGPAYIMMGYTDQTMNTAMNGDSTDI